MTAVTGDTKQLRPSQRAALEKLGTKKSSASDLVDVELAKAGSRLAAELGVRIGLLIGRDGRVTHVVLGARGKIYLPDLGRFRLDSARLRRLRLVVFFPHGDYSLRRFERTATVVRKRVHSGLLSNELPSSEGSKDQVLSPEVPVDLITDLEKLRLDAVAVISVTEAGVPGPLSLVHLQPAVSVRGDMRDQSAQRLLAFHHARDLYNLRFDFERVIADIERELVAVTSRAVEKGKERALLVGVYTGSSTEAQYSMAELEELARSAELAVADVIMQRRRSLDPKTVLGKGKLEEVVLHCLDQGADLIVFDQELSPSQLRSITNLTELRVIDRSMLILDIFARRARTSEGRLQVELAQLKYSLPRLTEKDTGLSRLTGGIGGRGPGETKLEIGRRRARDRINELEKRIETLARQRGVRRERRQSRGVPVISIVGYTNAGKSTLLNAITKGEVLAESKMFSTLDPASRRMRFPNDKEVIFVDTVGFIRELPRELVTAFRATLEEVGEADLLVHVVDASSHEMRKQIQVVEETLSLLGFAEKPRILILNKTDLLSEVETRALVNTVGGLPVSALERKGFEELVSLLQEELGKTFKGQDPGRFTEVSQW